MDHREGLKQSLELTKFEEYVGVPVPKKRILCPTCDGRGRHVNPGVDSHGITEREMWELGPQFEEEYFSGLHDVDCYECGGNKVVEAVDRQWLGLYDRELLKEWDKWWRDALDYEQMCESERRMGC